MKQDVQTIAWLEYRDTGMIHKDTHFCAKQGSLTANIRDNRQSAIQKNFRWGY
jgi:hypothetical protein